MFSDGLFPPLFYRSMCVQNLISFTKNHVLFMFNDNLFKSNYSFSFPQFCRHNLQQLLEVISCVISKYNKRQYLRHIAKISLIYSVNEVGPKMDPCGTPHVISCREDLTLPIWMNWTIILMGKRALIDLKSLTTNTKYNSTAIYIYMYHSVQRL